ncbi:MAG: hypothetical protein H6746_07255 [Deltaproteobacteria bacterium]|nr:hypothetical protein [Deltaproteobacteria bacterium]
MSQRASVLLVVSVGLAGVWLALALSACDGEGRKSNSGLDAPFEEYVTALRDCDLLSEGKLPVGAIETPELTSTQAACVTGCLDKATCIDFRDSVCNEGGGALQVCLGACTAFRCGNGDALDLSRVCDGEQDCADGSDERSCAPASFNCRDGGLIGADLVCNGQLDCVDGSDESSCATFVCNDGQTTPERLVCNGAIDCLDGSDELGCARFFCTDGPI